jgi:hypothetical protein
MKLNIPVVERLKDCQNVLIAGIGGGFDIYAGLPLYFELKALGKNVHLANYSFTELHKNTENYTYTNSCIHNKMVKLTSARTKVKVRDVYYPEGYLAEWFHLRGDDVPVWMFDKTGYKPLYEQYDELVNMLGIDAIVMVDGGVDSLMRGNEVGCGTIVEDAVSMSVINNLPVKVKILACIGFGTELEEEVCHYNVLENIAELAKMGDFLGTCSLTKEMECFQKYKEAYEFCANQPDHPQSHISSRIIPAVEGKVDPDSFVFYSPLMGIYWFFDMFGVAARNLLFFNMAYTTTFTDARQVWRQLFYNGVQRQPKKIPLT